MPKWVMDYNSILGKLVLRSYNSEHAVNCKYQFGCGILKMVGPKKQDFWPKINILKGNHCILRIRGAPVRQKLGMILENKVVQKLKLEKKNLI